MKNQNLKLLLSAIFKTLCGFGIMSLLLFLPAGTFQYFGAWYLVALLFVPMLIMGTLLFIKSPQLLQRRLQSKEDRSVQQGVIKYSALIFVAGFILASFDYRYQWSHVPVWLTHASALLFLGGYALYAEVMRENIWLSRNIQVEENQQVVSSGLYGIVRHPMYTATIAMFLSIPLILGSWVSFAIFMLYIPIIVRRILDEEKLLLTQLNGYDQYCQKLRWRLIPGVW